MFREYKKTLVLIATISLVIFCPVFLTGCGPSEEYKKVKQTLEQHPRITEKGAKVGEIRFLKRENQSDNDLRFEADLLDKDGNVIGKAEGFRVEGFGTRIFRVRYNDEPEPPPRERRRPRRREQAPAPTTQQNERTSANDLY